EIGRIIDLDEQGAPPRGYARRSKPAWLCHAADRSSPVRGPEPRRRGGAADLGALPSPPPDPGPPPSPPEDPPAPRPARRGPVDGPELRHPAPPPRFRPERP